MSQAMTQEAAKTYKDEMTVLASEVGETRFSEAITNCIRECSFFPPVAEIRKRVPPKKKLMRVTDPYCKDCSGSGWKYADPSNRDKGVNRCHCWHTEEVA